MICPNQEKFSNHKIFPMHYTYFDYISAWNQFFFYHNSKFSHSWFLKFNLTELSKPFPNWFVHWFRLWGPFITRLPTELRNSFEKVYELDRFDGKDETLLYFLAHYSSPWIIKWGYKLNYEPNSILNSMPKLLKVTMVKW